MTTKRYSLLDTIRGILLLNMIAYHTIWDMVYIFGADFNWFKSSAAFWWQQFICCGFILLSGICWRLGKSSVKHLKNGVVIMVAGAAVSAVTAVFTPQSAITFGILTFIGCAMIVLIPLEKLLKRVNSCMGLIISLTIFVLIRNINKGSVVFGKVLLSENLFHNGNWFMNFLGFTQNGFYSSDYFSFLPWFFLYLCGYFVSPALINNLPIKLLNKKIACVDFIGRHSLISYLIHQPAVYCVLSFIFGLE